MKIKRVTIPKEARRRLPEDMARSAEIGVFLMEVVHSVAISVSIAAAFILCSQFIQWLSEHETQVELAAHTAEKVIEEVA